MPVVVTSDGVDIFYNDWGTGKPILFSGAWALSGEMWESQMLFLASRGFRVIAYDRRGFGRSSQPWSGYDYDTLAADIDALVQALDLKDVMLVGFSMGGGDVVRYLTRFGQQRVARLVLVSAVTPYLGKAEDNPEGVDRDVFAGIKSGLEADKAEFIANFSTYYFGTNREGSSVSAGTIAQTLQMANGACLKAAIDCVTSFSETDFRDDLARIAVPTLIIHGDDDQTAPREATGDRAAQMITGADYKVYPDAPHALYVTHKQRLNEDLFAFATL